MGKILDDLQVNYTVGIDEAAFYGPSWISQYRNVFGKEDTIVTIQVDRAPGGAVRHGVCGRRRQEEAALYHPPDLLGCYERTWPTSIEKYVLPEAPLLWTVPSPGAGSAHHRTGPMVTAEVAW
ncbi:MAG: hypothetical protein ACLU9S_00525 [Oscillospiraceae bacterium]